MGCANTFTHLTTPQNIPFKSFAKIKKMVEVKVCGIPLRDTKNKKALCLTSQFLFNASGVIIKHIKEKNETYVLTAKHFCSLKNKEINEYIENTWNDYFKLRNFASRTVEIDQTVALHDYRGRLHTSVVVYKESNNNDICLLKSKHIKLPKIPISDGPPLRGQAVWNIAAPLGIFIPGSPPILQGIYSGTFRARGESRSYLITDLPAVPGSSGSPVFNFNGELVGLVYSTISDFPNVSYAVSLEEVKTFMWLSFH